MSEIVIGQFNLSTGAIKTVKLPQSGSIWPQTFDVLTNDCIMWVSSWKQPQTRYRYNPLTGQSTVSTLYPKIVYPGTDELVVEEIEVKSHDGAMVPLSLVYNKNIKKDGRILFI